MARDGAAIGAEILRAIGMDPSSARVTRIRLDVDLTAPVRMTVELERYIGRAEAGGLARALEGYELVKRPDGR